jgi:hypothetical protein
MTSKVTMIAHKEAEQDFAARAYQWIDENWHLPPGGDQTWREQDAQRMFSVTDAKFNDSGDPPPVEPISPTGDEEDGAYEPGFRHAGLRNVLLAVSLAGGFALFLVAISVPDIFTADFWRDAPTERSGATVPAISRVAGGENDAASDLSTPSLSAQIFSRTIGRDIAGSKAGSETAAPLLQPAVPTVKRHARLAKDHAVRVATTKLARQQERRRKLAARSLPPIGAAYFASHSRAATPGKLGSVAARPIGEPYFQSRPTASAD